MMIGLILLFTVLPALELFLLLQIGSWLGPTQTFLLVLVTGVLGAWLAKREGFAVLAKLSEELRGGLPPGSRLMEGALVVMGGLLLVTPGVITDLTGMLLIFPFSRRWIAPRALKWLAARFGVVELGAGRVTEEPPTADDGVRYRGPEPIFQRPERKATPFSSPFDD